LLDEINHMSRRMRGQRVMGEAWPRRNCLIPGFDGAVYSNRWKDALWARFTTGAPQRQRQSVERYVEQEATFRQQRRFAARARTAKLRHAATVEDVDYRTPRGLDRTMFLRLATCDWIREHRHCLITGPCGAGKSWLACALGDKACRENLSVLYQRSPRLFASLGLARGDGRYARLMRQFARVNLLILDDWGPEPLTAEQRRDLLEIVEDRYQTGSLIITSQVPVERWYEIVGDSTLS
jgi:DNA replication protein DnaC